MEKVWRLAGARVMKASVTPRASPWRDMEAAGVDILTDGEVGRESYFNLFATGLGGIDLDNPGSAVNRRGKTSVVPRVMAPIEWRRSPLSPAAAFLRSLRRSRSR